MNKKKYKLLVKAIIAVSIFLVVCIVIIVLGITQIDKYKTSIDNLMYEISSNRQVVYVVKDNVIVKKGELLLEDGENANVMRQEIYSGLEPEYYITEEDLGTLAIVDMEPETPIMKSMVTPMIISHDTRETEITVVNLMVDQKVNDYVDIRIMFPNGEDYLLLPKKQIKNLVLDSSIFYTYLNEEEILRLTCATVDAYTISGTKIYATRYVESNIQKEAIPDYKVSAATMDLMASDPNITTIAQDTLNLSARLSMEQRLQGLTKEQLAAVAEGNGLQDTAKASVLTNGVKYQLDEGFGTETETDVTTPASDTLQGAVEGTNGSETQTGGEATDNTGN